MTPKQTRHEDQHNTSGAADELRPQQESASTEPGGAEGNASRGEPQDDAAQESAASGAEGARAGDPAGELEATRDRYLRLAAEYDNYRKRTERERTESWGRAQAQLVERILDALDDLQRVTLLDAESTSAGSVLEGVQMVERKLIRQLEGAGLEVIDAAEKPFDPAIHEAIVSTPTEDEGADDTVAEVFQKGYSFKGNLIRPARVRVHKFGS